MKIDGHWEGFYEMEGSSEDDCNEWGMQKFRVEAWIEMDGADLTGRMVDHDRSWETSYASHYERFKENYSWIDARNAELFIKEFPDATMLVNGCRDSQLVGKVGQIEVNFFKKYQGKHETLFRFGNRETIERIFGGGVNYFGKLLDGGLIIKGTYRTVGDEYFASITGYFELRRVLR